MDHEKELRFGRIQPSPHLNANSSVIICYAGPSFIYHKISKAKEMHRLPTQSKMNSVSDCNSEDSATVILTGSTGSLGSYLLNSLMNQPHVRKIYCLNRSEDGQAKQKAISGSRGLATNWTDHWVEFLHVDLSRPGFGLSQRRYGQLLNEATHIIREFIHPFCTSMQL